MCHQTDMFPEMYLFLMFFEILPKKTNDLNPVIELSPGACWKIQISRFPYVKMLLVVGKLRKETVISYVYRRLVVR